MNQTTQYRAAVIGLGFVGAGDPLSGEQIGQKVEHLDGYHVQALERNSRVQLLAGCDLDSGRRERFAQRTGAREYADWRQMLDAERPEVVSVAASAPAHPELVAGCAAAGVRAIYCEKPIAQTIEEAERMLAACENTGALLAINHNRRFNPHYRRLRDRIAAGDLGKITGVSMRWSTGRFGCVGTHFIDSARMLTGQEVVAVSGTLDERDRPDCRGPSFHDPGGWALLRMSGGTMAVINAANAACGPGFVIVEGTTGRAITGGGSVRIDWYDGRTEDWPAGDTATTSMDRAVSEIVAWLDGARPFSTPAVEAVRTFEAIAAIHASHQRANGGWIDLPLSGDARTLRVRTA